MFTKRIGMMLVLGVAMAFVVSLGASSASAASLTFQFTSDHCTGGCLTGQTSGGTVTVTDTGANTVSVSVQLANGNQFVNTGFDASFGFNLAGNPTITYSAINPAAGFTIPGGNPQSAGSLHMDGTGFFEYGLEAVGSGGSQPQGSSLTFTITGTGLDVTDFQANADNQLFAADIISGTTGKTGGIDVSGGTVTTPEASSTLLLSLALIGVVLVSRKIALARG